MRSGTRSPRRADSAAALPAGSAAQAASEAAASDEAEVCTARKLCVLHQLCKPGMPLSLEPAKRLYWCCQGAAGPSRDALRRLPAHSKAVTQFSSTACMQVAGSGSPAGSQEPSAAEGSDAEEVQGSGEEEVEVEEEDEVDEEQAEGSGAEAADSQEAAEDEVEAAEAVEQGPRSRSRSRSSLRQRSGSPPRSAGASEQRSGSLANGKVHSKGAKDADVVSSSSGPSDVKRRRCWPPAACSELLTCTAGNMPSPCVWDPGLLCFSPAGLSGLLILTAHHRYG